MRSATPTGWISRRSGVPVSAIEQLMSHDPRVISIYTVAHAEVLAAALADAGAPLSSSMNHEAVARPLPILRNS